MRVAFSGNVEEARALLGKAQQELFRLKQRMTLRGDAQGSFHMQLSPLASVSMQVLPNGIEQIFIDVRPVPAPAGGEPPPVVEQYPSPYFEFFTSGKPVMTQTISQGNVTASNVYKAAVVSVFFDGKKVGAEILGGARMENTAEKSYLERAHQINLGDEPVVARSFPKVLEDGKLERTKQFGEYKKILYESWSPGHAFTGVFTRGYNTAGNGFAIYDTRGSFDVETVRDVGFDVPWVDSEGVAPVRTVFIQNDADWPRASGVQIVKSKFGDREFALYFDAFDQVSVFPTSAIEPLHQDPYEQNVPVDHVITRKIPLPGWVFQKSMKFRDFYNISGGDIGTTDFPELDWKMHPDGTKACSVVIERQAAIFDDAYFTDNVGTNPQDAAGFKTWCDEHTGFAARHQMVIDPDHLPQRYLMGVGLLEITLDIAIVGPDTKNFTFGITVTEVRRPITSPYCPIVAGYVWYDIEAKQEEGATEKTYIADRGDFISLDIERYYHPTLGGRGSFYSLKNLTKKTEMFTTTAYTLIDYDLPTASFVFGFENNEDVKRTIKPRFDVTGNAPPHERTFTITHQCALIYIFGKLNILLFPDTLPQAQRDIFIANSTLDIRKQVGAPNSGWVYMPMNDMRDWHNDPELMNLRLWYSIWYNWKTGAPQDIHDIPPELNNWWALGMLVYFVPTMLLQMTVPRFGWFIYDDEIVNRLQVSPRSVFFVHPSGTWAFFDQHRVYNSYGMDWEVGPNAYDDTLTPAISDMVLEHMVYDFVHLEQEHGSVDTSFTALYTQAVTTGKAAGTLKEEFQPVSRTDLKIKFTKERVAGSGGIEWLQLKCDWYPNPPFYYYEFGYQGGSGQHGYMVDAGGLMDMTLGCVAYTGPIYGTPIFHPILRNTPVTFSSCVMVTNNG